MARYADLVHSVDRRALVAALAGAAHAAGRRLECLVQVSLDGDTGRGGVAVDGRPRAGRRGRRRQDGLALRGGDGGGPARTPIRTRAFALLPGLRERLPPGTIPRPASSRPG